MSLFRFKEARESRQSGMNPPFVNLIYNASGSNDAAFVRSFAFSGAPSIVATTYGILYREDIILDPAGFEQWKVTVPFGLRKYEIGEFRFRASTTGGTAHITQSRGTVVFLAPGATDPDNKGTIGVRGPDEIDGTEIVIPALKVNIYFRHPQAFITMAKIVQMARATGTVNEDSFLGFAPGEVLFLGLDCGDGTQTEAEVEYQFAMSENITGQTAGDITGIAKPGWDYLWFKYKDNADNNVPAKQPEYASVERVYRRIAFQPLFGFGA